MNESAKLSSIHINKINLWAHVGVLEEERLYGQSFLLDITIWVDLEEASKKDDLSLTTDYSLAVKSLQDLSFSINCMTIEHFSELILNKLEHLYGALPIQILLKKTTPPIDGFSGNVAIFRQRNFV